MQRGEKRPLDAGQDSARELFEKIRSEPKRPRYDELDQKESYDSYVDGLDD